ncbi:MAG: transcriptional repressor [Desulfuromonas sp.]|nr:MAG: transcriptional repressor [Desulfuromonas sp.]
MDQIQIFTDYLRQQGLKNTSQRMVILEVFLNSNLHYSTEELYLKLRKSHPRIGYATVHRTLKLLAECGLASELNFGDGQTRYEPCRGGQHHDHLVCTRCGKIIEFVEPRIEKLQEEVAERYGFKIMSHRHELYGLCSDCSVASES